MSIVISILSFFALWILLELTGYNDIESILLILCSIIIGCTFSIIQTIKRINPEYKFSNPFDSIFNFFQDEYDDFNDL